MVNCLLMGGLGNQLFQFAAAYAYAKKTNQPLVIDLGFINQNPAHGGYRLNNLLLGNHIVEYRSSGYIKNIIFRVFMKFPDLFSMCVPSIIHDSIARKDGLFPKRMLSMFLGYWQDEVFFSEHRVFLHKNIVPTNVSDTAKVTAALINKDNTVSLHVRRGDYINNLNALSVHGVCSISFYKNSIARMKSEVPGAHFFVFTNDAKWVTNELNELFDDLNVTYVEGNTQEEDLWLMSQAKHHIIANSSFSWWGAWLAKHEQQIVIAPTPWYDKPPKYSHDPSLADWIRLPK